MRVFIVFDKGVIHDEVFTSLKMACEHSGVGYSSASKGKRVFITPENQTISIIEATIVKIKGRENNSGRKNPKIIE
jgi:hypothetical protein